MKTTELVIRPPWPDECERAWKLLPGLRGAVGEVAPLVGVTGFNERIVAAAALRLGPPMPGRVELLLRTRFCTPDYCGMLLEGMETRARVAGLKEITLVAAESAPWNAWMSSSGFEEVHREENWEIRRGSPSWERRAAQAHRVVGRLREADLYSLAAPVDNDVNDILALGRALTGTEPAVEGERALAGGGGSEAPPKTPPLAALCTPAFSTVVRRGGELAGLMLVSDGGNRVVVRVRAVSPAFSAQARSINALMLHRFARLLDSEPQYQTVDQVLFRVVPERDREVAAFAARSGGSRVSAFRYYRKRLDA